MAHREEDSIVEIFRKEIRKVEQTLDKIDQFYKKDLPFLDRLSDRIAEIGGSWLFISSFVFVLVTWIILNALVFFQQPFDPPPFILLNLVLSCLAALQAPIILMAQNRAAKRDQARVELDLEKDLRDLKIDQSSHKILLGLQKDVRKLKRKMKVK